MTDKIYFDHSATTPVDKKVLRAMLPYFKNHFGNASSIHSFGQAAIAGVDAARQHVADFLNCSTEEVVFTSGATESNNIAIYGLVNALRSDGVPNVHIITSAVEHDAVLEPCRELAKDKAVKVTILPVDRDGRVLVEDVKSAITDDTALVSIMSVNSEVGIRQPIREIGKEIKKINERRLNDWMKLGSDSRGQKPRDIVFHTDATQAANFFNCDVSWNYIDMLSFSGHKIYGPKGVGVLYKKKGIRILPIVRGGHQEMDLRSGTMNVPGIVGMGEAVALLGKRREKGKDSSIQTRNNKKIGALRDLLISSLSSSIPDLVLNTNTLLSTPSHAHFTFMGVEGESALMSLDFEGIAVSTGSACASGSLDPSHVLLAMGVKKEVAHYSIRFTLGKHNKEEEIAKLAAVLPPIIAKLRKMNPLYGKP